MSFTMDNTNSRVYAPGWFLADNENCERKTRQIAQLSATTAPNGTKFVPMGTIYPSNDAYATGIVYEDVDVTSGDMPGSVVTKGVIYEDRLAFTSYDYDSITLKNLVSPKAQGWQERSGEVDSYVYTDSTDETVNTSKTYYLKDADHTAVTNWAAVLNPSAEGWYESDGGTGYVKSTDTTGDKTKTYYEQEIVRMSSAAKSALEALGFKFITEPTVTRPY